MAPSAAICLSGAGGTAPDWARSPIESPEAAGQIGKPPEGFVCDGVA